MTPLPPLPTEVSERIGEVGLPLDPQFMGVLLPKLYAGRLLVVDRRTTPIRWGTADLPAWWLATL